MKKTVYFILILFTSISLNGSTLNDTLQIWMDEGNTAYQNKQYEKAISQYQNIIDKNFESAILFYNLGNAYYKNNEKAKSLLWYERALKLEPSNDDIIHNITFVNQKLEDKIETLPELFITRWFQSTASSLSAHQWAILSIVSFGILLLSILCFLLIHKLWIRYSSVISHILALFIFIFSIYFAIKNTQIMKNHNDAIVMKSIVVGKSAPNDSGNDLFVIHEGLKVQITDQLNDWYEIKLPNGEKGWVAYTEIERI
jgi:tetratricopeptide (TPR) repeat protein